MAFGLAFAAPAALTFASATRYEYPIRVADEMVFQNACSILDQRRPGHSLRTRKYVVWYLTSPWDVALLVKDLEAHPERRVGFDYETRNWSPKKKLKGILGGEKAKGGLNPLHPAWQADPVTVQLSWGQDVYVVGGHLLYLLANWIWNISRLDVANASFESHASRNKGIPFPRFENDLLHLDFLLEETTRQRRHRLKLCELDYLGIEALEWEDTFGGKSFEQVLGENSTLALEYAGMDPHGTTLGCDILIDKLEKRYARQGYNSYELYQHWERPFQTSHIRMEQAGVPIVQTEVHAHNTKLTQRIEEVDAAAFKALGRPMNLSSPKQLSKYYFQERKLPVFLTTDSCFCLACNKAVTKKTNRLCPVHGDSALVNNASTDESVLTLIEAAAEKGLYGLGQDPLPKILGERRTLDKARSTWVDGIYKFSQGLGIAYPSLRANFVVSGRFSGDVWLTFPKVSDENHALVRGLRSMIGFPEDSEWNIVAADEAQVELRILAHYSQDSLMMEAFLSGKDLHAWTAALIVAFQRKGMGVLSDLAYIGEVYETIRAAHEKADKGEKLTVAEATLESMRSAAKSSNFGIVYGMGPEKLASQLGISKKEAQAIFDAIWVMYQGLKTYFDFNLAQVKKTLEMRTLIGRNRRILELASANQAKVGAGERLVKNTPCQAGAGDVLRGAMIQVAVDLEAGGAYGTVGRGAFGFWIGGDWHPDWSRLPKGWKDNLPKALADGLGTLGKLGAEMFMQVHDELLLKCRKKDNDVVQKRVKALMEDPFGADLEFKCPLRVKAGHGRSWLEAK